MQGDKDRNGDNIDRDQGDSGILCSCLGAPPCRTGTIRQDQRWMVRTVTIWMETGAPAIACARINASKYGECWESP